MTIIVSRSITPRVCPALRHFLGLPVSWVVCSFFIPDRIVS